MMMLPAPACTMQGLIVRAGCPYVDPDLQQALAASQTDEELRHAIQASLQDQKQSVPTASSTHTAKGQGNVSRGGLSAPFAPSGMSPASQTPPSPSEPVLLTAKGQGNKSRGAGELPGSPTLVALISGCLKPCQLLLKSTTPPPESSTPPSQGAAESCPPRRQKCSQHVHGSVPSKAELSQSGSRHPAQHGPCQPAPLQQQCTTLVEEGCQSCLTGVHIAAATVQISRANCSSRF